MKQLKIEAIKQRIYHLTEIRKLIITGIIVLIGGLSTLFIHLIDWKEFILFIVGTITAIILFFLNKELAIDVEKQIRHLEKGE